MRQKETGNENSKIERARRSRKRGRGVMYQMKKKGRPRELAASIPR